VGHSHRAGVGQHWDGVGFPSVGSVSGLGSPEINLQFHVSAAMVYIHAHSGKNEGCCVGHGHLAGGGCNWDCLGFSFVGSVCDLRLTVINLQFHARLGLGLRPAGSGKKRVVVLDRAI
jgi:hypothetical protein